MPTCTFFGHGNSYGLKETVVQEAVENLIHQGVDTFYVGNHGNFDGMVYACLKRLRKQYPHIRVAVVLAYLPTQNREFENTSDTMYPEGLELGLPRFAIERRNRWMIAASQFCVCYVNYTWGGAYKFAKLAKRRGLTCINLGELDV